ncbi:hypothetical protein [Paenibacillus sp. 1P07SE]|uniref:hypothetical protein n=1 Tax=Paenibacillus sp. 1P07SE TaxID=3132209 RepID=UPI0039A56648
MTKDLYMRQFRRLAAATALTIALSGCQQSPADSPSLLGQASDVFAPAGGHSEGQQPAHAPGPGAETPQQSYDRQPPAPRAEDPLVRPDEAAKGHGTGENVRPSQGDVTSDVIEEKWNTNVPKLINLAIGESITKATEQFGDAAETYILADDEDQITVNGYNGFAIGYGKDQQIRFIEVFESGVRTGLNGVRIGDFEENVLEALGKPTTHTSYVIGYKAKSTLLKFDMDPKSREILSIKLFLQV